MSKSIKVKSVVFPEKPLSFNEWAEQMNVSVLYTEPRKPSGHYYTLPPLEYKSEPFFKRLVYTFKSLFNN